MSKIELRNKTDKFMQEFLAKGGQVKHLELNDSTRRRIDKLRRIHARMIKNDQLEDAKKVSVQI